jgi:cytochrome c553
MKKFILILLFIPTTAFAAPVFEKFTSLPDPVSIKEGKKLYQENGCPLCHGDEGRGDGAIANSLKNKPRNFKDYDEMKRMPNIRMEQAIHDGLEGTAMPTFSQFSQSQTEALTNYLRSFLMDSYFDLQMCAFQTYHIDAKNLSNPFSVEVDEPEKFEAEIQGKTISFRGKDWTEMLDKKATRTHFRVMQDDHIVSLVSVKIVRCIKDLKELLKSITPTKNQDR